MRVNNLNIGCGATPTPGWSNFDNSWTVRAVRNPILRILFFLSGQLRNKESYLEAIRQHGVRWADATRCIPVPDSSAEIVYSSHMVEHLTKAEMHGFLSEAFRVLKPGGILRIAVPDIDYHLGLYAEHGDSDRLVAGLCMSGDAPRSFLGKVRHALVGERHHLWMYNGAAMAREMEKAGFIEAAAIPAGATRIVEPGALDLSERAPESVFVEAVCAKSK